MPAAPESTAAVAAAQKPSGTGVVVRLRCLAAAFAFICGYADVISVLRWQCFATIMTGNAVFVARSYGDGIGDGEGADAVYRLAVIGAWVVGVVAYVSTEMRFPNRGASMVSIPLIFLWLVSETALVMQTVHSSTYRYTVVAYSPLFGVLNAASAAGKLATPTSLLTGHLTVVGNAIARILNRTPLDPAFMTKLYMSLIILASTMTGGFVGAFVHAIMPDGSHGSLLPVGPLLVFCFWFHDHLARPQSIVEKIRRRRERKTKRDGSPQPEGNQSDSESDDEDAVVAICSMAPSVRASRSEPPARAPTDSISKTGPTYEQQADAKV